MATFVPSGEVSSRAHVSSMEQYRSMYDRSIRDPDGFWGELAKELFWKVGPSGALCSYNFDIGKGPISIKWFAGAKTNLAYNALDRNVEKGFGDKTAFLWYNIIYLSYILNYNNT